VQDAVACEPAGCIGATLPFAGITVEPFAVPLAVVTATVGNAHSNASEAIVPGGWGLPSIVCCWYP
jgi:hypothetical protein